MPNSSSSLVCALRRASIAMLAGLFLPMVVVSVDAAPTLTSSSRLGPAAATRPHPAICRIIAPSGRSISYGSGSLIAVSRDRGIVITNWHVVNEATGDVSVVFPNGFHSPARVLRTNRDWDLAALAIRPPQIPPIALSTTAPQRGEPLTIAGYGSGTFRAITGRCTQYVSPGHRHPFHMVEVSVAARQGDSGGPIINRRGELAGVLFGAGAGTTTGSYVGRVRWFLETAGVTLGDDRTMIAQQTPRPRTEPQNSARGSSSSQTFPKQPGVPLRDPRSPAVAATTPGFRTPHVSAPARTGNAAPVSTLRWQDLAGESLFAQAKSVLAVIGLFSLLAMGLRRSS